MTKAPSCSDLFDDDDSLLIDEDGGLVVDEAAAAEEEEERVLVVNPTREQLAASTSEYLPASSPGTVRMRVLEGAWLRLGPDRGRRNGVTRFRSPRLTAICALRR